MSKEIAKIMKNKSIGIVFLEILNNSEGILTTEIARKLKKSHSTISRQIDVIEKAGFIKTKVKEDRVLKKLYYPTLKPLFEMMARSFKVELTQEDYEIIDDFLFYPPIKKVVFEMDGDVSILLINVHSIIFKAFVFEASSGFQEMLKNDKELKERFEKYKKTMSKFPITYRFLN